ncbi:hypothetical protein IJI00_02755 [Candidatus Saccharibacteria bacterium]|nr:hypothetical protein [Candidatus Saccharibacteria bacterium]
MDPDVNDESNIFTVTPMSQKITLEPGFTYTGEIIVAIPVNAKRNFSYRVSVAPYNVIGEDYYADLTNISKTSAIVDWITIDNPTGTLAPNELAHVKFHINVPSDAGGGGQYAALMVGSDEQQMAGDGISVGNVFELASIIYAEVEGEIIHEGEILENTIPEFSSVLPIRVAASVTNNGNIHETARVFVTVEDAWRSTQIYPAPGETNGVEEEIMPGTTRYITRDIDGISPLGIYRVKQDVIYMGERDTTTQIVVACPVWFMVLMIVVLSSVIVGVVLAIRRHREKRKPIVV